MNTYGNTGNEGQRVYGDGNGDMNTSGNRGNESSRHRVSLISTIPSFLQDSNAVEVFCFVKDISFGLVMQLGLD